MGTRFTINGYEVEFKNDKRPFFKNAIADCDFKIIKNQDPKDKSGAPECLAVTVEAKLSPVISQNR